MEKHELIHLETQAKEMCQNLAHLADDTDFQEPIGIIQGINSIINYQKDLNYAC